MKLSLKYLAAISTNLLICYIVYIFYRSKIIKFSQKRETFIDKLRVEIELLKYDIADLKSTAYYSSLSLRGIMQKIPLLNITSTIDATKLANKRKPLKFTSTEINNWTAVHWDIWDLALRWPILENMLQLKTRRDQLLEGLMPLFIIESDPSGSHGGLIGATLEAGRPTTIRETLFITFLIDLKNSSTKYKYFYSTNYRNMEQIAKMTGDATWQSLLVHEKFGNSSNVTADAVPPSLWMQSPHCSIQARYSPTHMFATQLLGQSRYILFPPDQTSKLYLYPSIHVSDKQSQVNLYQEQSELLMVTSNSELEPESDFPRSHTLQGYVTVLSSGQSLYIPPYWHVLREGGDGLSMGLDVHSPSIEHITLLEAYSAPLPFKGLLVKSAAQRIIASQVYLSHVLSRVEGVQSPLWFARELYETRYKELYPEQGLFLQRNLMLLRQAPPSAPSDEGTTNEPVDDSANISKGAFDCYRSHSKLRTKLGLNLDPTEVTRAAQFIASRVNSDQVPPSVRLLWLGDYVEQIARWAMGDPERTVLFIRECLDQPKSLKLHSAKEARDDPGGSENADAVEVKGPLVLKIGKHHYKDEEDFKRMIREDLENRAQSKIN